MQIINKRLVGVRNGLKIQTLVITAIFLGISLLVSACGDNTSTAAPSNNAANTVPATTAVAATTVAATTTTAATTAAITTGSATTAAGTTSAVSTAAPSGTGTAKLSLESATAQAGTTIAVKGDGFPANSWVTIEFGPGTTTRQVASLALVDSTGKFNSPLILSAYGDGSKLVPGANLIKATSQDGKVTASIPFNIVPAPANTTPKA